MRILNFGSINLDYVYSVEHFVQAGETILADELQIFPGGKGLNQSIALARSGIPVFHAGMIGEGDDFLIELMKKAGVNTRYIRSSKESRTGNAVIQRDQSGNNCIILHGGANQRISREYIDEVLSDFSEKDFLFLQNEISNMAYLMEKAHERGMRIILNPSPMNEALRSCPLCYVNYFILNEIEIAQLLGGDEKREEEQIHEMLKRFPGSKIVLTLGKRGSLYAEEGMDYRQDIYPAKVMDTTAAGDSFTGYFVSGIWKGYSAEESMDLASKAASLAVASAGAEPSIPKIEELEAAFPSL